MTDTKIIELLFVVLLLGFLLAVHLWHMQQMKIDNLREIIRLHMTKDGTVRVTGAQVAAVLKEHSYRQMRTEPTLTEQIEAARKDGDNEKAESLECYLQARTT